MRLLLPFSALALCVASARADVLISEVCYDHVGPDDGFEWIELVDTGVTPVDLTGYTIGAGGADYIYAVTALSGTIGACETFVIGVNSAPENASPVIDLVADFDPDIQNGGSTADGVALFAPGDDPAIACPLDAFVYGIENLSGLIDETCALWTRVANAGARRAHAKPISRHMSRTGAPGCRGDRVDLDRHAR